MKLSDKIERTGGYGKGHAWYSHARQLEAQVEEHRRAAAALLELKHDLEAQLAAAEAERQKHAAISARIDVRPPLDLVDPQVVAMMAAIMRQSGVHRITFNPRRVLRDQGDDMIQVSRDVVDDTLELCLVDRDGKPIKVPGRTCADCGAEVPAGQGIGISAPEADWPDRSKPRPVKVTPLCLSCIGKRFSGRDGFVVAGEKAITVMGDPQPAILVNGEPDVPCVPERNGKHEWYSDGKGGAFCRRCGLQTVQGFSVKEGGDHV